jgi:TrmH family RNA methyltransferase
VQGHLLLLYRLNNPNNLGAIMRSAHWFGFAGIILSRDSVDFTHPKVVRASMGSIFYLSLIADAEFAEILPRLKERYRLAGSDVRIGVPPHVCAKPTALLMGSESHGLPDDLSGMADEIWRIPGTGGAESLSLPQAAAVLMYACTVSS